MNALTLTQPWASLSVMCSPRLGHPFKEHETRAGTVHPPRVLPVQLAIHAGKNLPKGLEHIVEEGWLVEPYREFVEALGFHARDPWRKERGVSSAIELPLGAVVGVVTITHIYKTESIRRAWYAGEFPDEDYVLGDYSDGRGAWKMENAIALTTPIVTRGYQGIWQLPPWAEEDVRNQIEKGRTLVSVQPASDGGDRR